MSNSQFDASNPSVSGISIYWDNDELTIEPYNKVKKVYYCGKELLKFKEQKVLVYQILLIDYDEAYLGRVYSDGEIVKVFHKYSYVPKKHKAGGQSAQRYARIREEKIKCWFKSINEKLKEIDGDLIVGMSTMYRNNFKKYLSTYNLNKIKQWEKIEYNGLTGIYQLVGKLEPRKQKRI